MYPKAELVWFAVFISAIRVSLLTADTLSEAAPHVMERGCSGVRPGNLRAWCDPGLLTAALPHSLNPQPV
jgi:hypothetical protein